MSTLAIMKARIADELSRSDLTSQIALAISDAIAAYEDERFLFNESRNVVFSTTASQEFYDSTDAAAIGTINKIDYAVVTVNGDVQELRYQTPEDMEHLSDGVPATGAPWDYTFYDQQIRLYPTPDAAYTVRFAANVIAAAPASDGETGNPWMTYAERLIRSRAKNELALHVTKDMEEAQRMAVAVQEAYDQLKGRTNMLTQTPGGRVKSMEF